jgi:V8-like Glu-specific endopeptidase
MKSRRLIPSFSETGLKSPITEFALALIARRGTDFSPSGTAIVIAPALAMTARHVVEGHWRDFEAKSLAEGESTGTFSLQCFQVLNASDRGALWDVTRMWLSPHTDIAFLGLQPGSASATNYAWKSPPLNILPPAVGERVTAFGYAGSQVTFREGEAVDELVWKDSPSTSVGEVIEVHHAFRDRGVLRFPCYRVNARFDPGMSGGPVFDDSGALRGLVCSGLPPEDQETDHVSYAVTLWPSLATILDMPWPSRETQTAYPALELARAGYLNAASWERVFLGPRQGDLIKQVGLRK